MGETTRWAKRLVGAKRLGGKRLGGKRLGGETTRGGEMVWGQNVLDSLHRMKKIAGKVTNIDFYSRKSTLPTCPIQTTNVRFVVCDNGFLQIFYNCSNVEEIFSWHNLASSLSQYVQQKF